MPNLKGFLGHRLPSPVVKSWHTYIRPLLPDWSFITIHYLYFLTVIFATSLIFWGASTPSKSISYIDSLFLVTSAMTEAGLNTLNLSTFNSFQQILLFILIILGSAIWVSIATVHVRIRAFEPKLQELADRRRKKRLPIARTFYSAVSKTFSKAKRSSGDEREDAIASGAVRGRAIITSEESSRDDISSGPRRHIKFEEPSERTNGDENIVREVNEELSPPTTVFEPSPASTNGYPNSGTPPTVQGKDLYDGDPAYLSAPSQPEKVQIIESPHPRNQDGDSIVLTPSFRRTHKRVFTGGGVGARSNLYNHPRNAAPIIPVADNIDDEEKGEMKRHDSLAFLDKYLKGFNGLVGRNSQFHGLTEKERRELGGLEYDALIFLSYLVPMYFILFQLIGAIAMGAWFHVNMPEVTRQNGLNPFWTGTFFAISAFNNSGMALLDANATILQTSYFPLLTLGFLILAGNTCFPPFLRLIIWTIRVCIQRSGHNKKWTKRRQVLQFLLDHPRRCYTHLFPSAQTWWLVGTLVALNGVDWAAFELLSIGNAYIESIPPKYRALDGLFQAFAVRSGGFYVVNISLLRPGLLCLYIYMMYLSALPVTLTLRNTNIYEERSLGIFAEELANNSSGNCTDSSQYPRSPSPTLRGRGIRRMATTTENLVGTLKRHLTGQMDTGSALNQTPPTSNKPPENPATTWSSSDFLRQQIRGQLSHDLWWIALAVFIITIIETSQFNRDPIVFSTFNIIFECVSAYGCVGISVGVPWNTYSFSGTWHTGSKVVLCAVMLRGRHRGLPVAVDRAVLVPDERLGWAEEEDAVMRNRAASRSRSRTFGPGVGLERTGSIGVATPGSRTTRRDEVD